MKLVRMTPGHGDVVLAEGDPELSDEHERLIEEFRRQLEMGMWAAVPLGAHAGRHEALMVRDFDEIPAGTERVIFFPPAAGGASLRGYVRDRGRDVRAEARARELLRTAAGDAVADAYEELGFVGVTPDDGRYAYIVYPHRPIVAYDTASGELLSEYCVRFPDHGFEDRTAGEWLPDADDVLAKWMGLEADERRLLASSNVNIPGTQLDPAMVRRDVAALRAWRVATPR
jgi:hypothetical protein